MRWSSRCQFFFLRQLTSVLILQKQSIGKNLEGVDHGKNYSQFMQFQQGINEIIYTL